MKKTGKNNKPAQDQEILEGEIVKAENTESEAETSAPEQPGTEAASTQEEPAAISEESSTETDSSAKSSVRDEAPAEPTPAPAETPVAAVKQPASWPGKVALVVSFVALGAAGYLYWQSMQTQQQNQALQASINSQVEQQLNQARSGLKQDVAAMNQQIGQLQQSASNDKANIDKLQDRLTRSIQQVTAKQHNSRKDWLLAEVEYLLRLANQRVLMEKTPDGALQLLKSADKILQETDDVSIYDVRKALAADIAALEGVPKLDAEGVFLKLGAMTTHVNQLRVIPVTASEELPKLIDEITPDTVSESWNSGLTEAWNSASDKLSSLVVIQQRDEPVEPLLSPDQKYYLQQNLLLMLEQAQLALLQRKQKAYDNALVKAEEWVSTYFEAEDSATQALIRGLGEAKKVQVAPEIPTISGSLNSLKDYLSRMAKLKQEGAA